MPAVRCADDSSLDRNDLDTSEARPTRTLASIVKKLIVVALLFAACSRSETPSLDATLDAELSRLDATLKTMAASNLAKSHAAAVARARAAKSTDLKLYRLRDAWVGVETLAFLKAHRDANADIAKMEALWNERGPAIAKKPVAHGSALQRALTQAASNRAQKLYRASLPYGKTSGAGDGLYYLAEADANARFGELVASLPGGDDTTPAYALDESMQSLERDMLQAFAADPSGKTTIPVSTRLKESHELLDQHLDDGAALMLVEARLRLDRKTDDELPAMLARVGQALLPVRGQTRVSVPHVKITLVRWPYT